MAAGYVIVESLVSLWRIPSTRRYFPGLFIVISILGSVLKELELVPQTYFSDSKNFLNLYFVDVSWGWTLLLLSPFIALSNFLIDHSVSSLSRRLLALPVATVVWYVFTKTFFYIEGVTGSCYNTMNMDHINDQFSTKSSCRQAGLHWIGYNISGNSFILTYSALFIVEEIAPMGNLKNTSLSARHRMVLNFLYVALNCIVLLWVWMFTCTSVYFHNPLDKLLGTFCALSGWYGTYKVWYLKALSPGLPPPRHRKKQ